MSQTELEPLGWNNLLEQQLAEPLPKSQAPVRVVGVHRSGWMVIGATGESTIPPRMRGDERPVTVGDWLIYDRDEERAVSLLERRSLFKRRAPGTDRSEQLIAANVDTLFIVSSCNQDFNEARVERYLSLAHEAEVMPVVVLTKADLSDDPKPFVTAASRLSPGMLVEAVNALDRASLHVLDPWLAEGQTIALLGSSGVGKSTLTNTLMGDKTLATQSVRKGDDKGQHTTTARHMYRIPNGAWILDTPGMRELQLVDVQSGIGDVFAELAELGSQCRFTDCGHESEPGCAVMAAIESGEIEERRVRSWRKLLREEAMNRETIAERRARDRATGRLYKSIIDDSHHKKGRR